MASPAVAADLPSPVYKAPMYSPIPVFSWTGFYAGINGGYAWGSSSWTTPTGVTTGDFDIKGAMAGGTIGYNLQTGVWVWGVEADLDYSWVKGTSTSAICGAGCETKNRWFATGRGRIGYAFDRWLPFVTGGVAVGDVKMTPAGGSSETDTKVGWTVGGGVEYAFLGPWSAKLEYLYADLGTANCSAATCFTAAEVKFKTNIVRAGLNYRF
ncbi:MAG: porin family protein [Pseudolabrys sp.]|nr:porin family protein [Pseudolabrys sp.]